MAAFRKAFSEEAKPPYCQIAMKNGVIQRWGLVEYATAEEAEAALERTNGIKLGDGDDGEEGIRVQFCTPGVRAINIYMDFVNNPMDSIVNRDKRALLEEAPSSKARHFFPKLLYSNLMSISISGVRPIEESF